MQNTRLMNTLRVVAPAIAVALVASACASHKFVRKQDDETRSQVDEVASDVDRVQGDVTRLDEELDGVSLTAQEALDRAIAAGELAEGKFLYETVLTDDAVKFGFDQSVLSTDAQLALDDFANEIKERNENVYIEIQGHTDSTGPEDYNLKLGEERAQTVREYLSKNHGFVLHRMNVISYGESAPTNDNSSRDGRAQNRRVALVVLQ